MNMQTIQILLLLFDGIIKLAPWRIVTETMDRIGYGSSESLTRSPGIIAFVCAGHPAFALTSILGAILLTGQLDDAMASHVGMGSPLFNQILAGFYLGVMVWGGFWLHDRKLPALMQTDAHCRQLRRREPFRV